MKQILVIDDNEDTAQMFARFLESHGYECKVANGGEVGLELFGRQSFDLAIIDLMMSGSSGFDVGERIRGRNNSIPMLLVTGRDDDVLVTASARHAGFNDVMVKPIEPDALLQKVRDLTGERGAHGEC